MPWTGREKEKAKRIPDTGQHWVDFPWIGWGFRSEKMGTSWEHHGGYFMIFHGANAANANDDLLGGSSAALCFHFNGCGRLQLRCTEPVMWLMRQEWQEAMSWFRTSRQHTKLSGISIYSDILALCLAFSLACVQAQVWPASGAGEKNSLGPAVAD